MRIKIELEYGIVLECDNTQSQIFHKIFDNETDIKITCDTEFGQITFPSQKIESITYIKGE
jgi:hypothetical protein